MSKSSLPRVFVGTLHSGEAEFDACLRAVREQVGVVVVHHVISGMPELDAHNQLWQAWNATRSDYDMFVKVDADTVLRGKTVLAQLATLFARRDGPRVAQIPLHDFFTDRSIMGLNVFSKEIEFLQGDSDALYADRVRFTPCQRFTFDEVLPLAPIGWHAMFPHARQAFFYGYHRMLKRQYCVLRDLACAWRKAGDAARCNALIGAVAALCVQLKDVNYDAVPFSDLANRCTAELQLHRRIRLASALFLLFGDNSPLRRATSVVLCRFIIPFLFRNLVPNCNAK